MSFMRETINKYNTNITMRNTPSKRLSSNMAVLCPTRPSSPTALPKMRSLRKPGNKMNSPTANNTPKTTANAIQPLPGVSSSGEDTSALRMSVRMPVIRLDTKLTTPRTTGTLRYHLPPGSRCVSSSMPPSGVRTAIAMLCCPRIITPSMSACPPIMVRRAFFSFSFFANKISSCLSLPVRLENKKRPLRKHGLFSAR